MRNYKLSGRIQNTANGILSLPVRIFANLFRYRNLIWLLARKGLISEFKKSFFGALWLIIFPLLNVLIWLILHWAGVFNPGDTGIPYPAFVLLNMVLWYLFIGAYQSTNLIMARSGKLLLQAYIPPEVIWAQAILVHLINFLVPFVFVLVTVLVMKVSITPTAIFFPVVALPLLLAGVSLGFIMAVFRIVAVDLFSFLDKIIPLLIYVSPVLYPAHVSSEFLSTAIAYNPLSPLITSAREIMISGVIPDWGYYLASSVAVIFVFLITLRFFLVATPRLIEKLAL